MLIKEYRIPLPLTVEEYRIAQLYMIIKKSREESNGAGSGVEIVKNEPYENGPGGNGGQYTFKIYHIERHLPTWFKAIIPASAMRVEEEAWNAYPYTKTRYRCPFIEKFTLEVETRYKNDYGEQENIFQLKPQEIEQRVVEFLDIVQSQPVADDTPEENPAVFHSEKTGRGPLSPDWFEQMKKKGKKEIMCAYKLCRVEFRYWGMQSKCERFICEIALRKTILRAHRQAWCWQEEFQGLTLADIRRLEDDTQHELNQRMARFHNRDIPSVLSSSEETMTTTTTESSDINKPLSTKRNRQLSIDNISSNRSRLNSFPVPVIPRGEQDDDEFFDAESQVGDLATSPTYLSLYNTSASLEDIHLNEKNIEYDSYRSSVDEDDTTRLISSADKCSIDLLILIFYAGNIYSTEETFESAKKTDFFSFRATFDNVVRNHYPRIEGKTAIRFVSCEAICTEAISVLNNLSPYGVSTTKDMTYNENLPLHAIPLFAISNPDYHLKVSNTVEAANKVYNEFITSKDGKNFCGQIVVIGDSNGAILAYDAVCIGRNMDDTTSLYGEDSNTPRARTPGTQKKLNNALSTDGDTLSIHSSTKYNSLTKNENLDSISRSGDNSRSGVTLAFDVNEFFSFGSPLSLILAYRRLLANNLVKPYCGQLYNLFHACDPNAARIEPLIVAEFAHIQPCFIPRYSQYPMSDGESTLLVEYVHRYSNLFLKSQKDSLNAINNVNSVMPTFSHVVNTNRVSNGMDINADTIFSNIRREWWGSRRIDYILYCPDSLMSQPAHILPIVFHSSYWESRDVIAFILRQITRTERNVPVGNDPVIHRSFAPDQATEKWLHRTTAVKIRNLAPNHRANDTMVVDHKPQIISAKFHYGPIDMVCLANEKVDIYVMRSEPYGEWLLLNTNETDAHGRIRFKIPEDMKLPLGMHPVKLVVRGDHTSVDLYLTVLPPNSEAVVFSIDGSFTASFSVSASDPKVRPGAVDVVRHWRELGYIIIYITARPDIQQHKVVHWLAQHNFPHGMTLFNDGLSREPIKNKTEMLRSVIECAELTIGAAYGSSKDVPVYQACKVPADRIFVIGKFKNRLQNQARFLVDGYALHLAELTKPGVCRPARSNARHIIRKACFNLPKLSSLIIHESTPPPSSPSAISSSLPVHIVSNSSLPSSDMITSQKLPLTDNTDNKKSPSQGIKSMSNSKEAPYRGVSPRLRTTPTGTYDPSAIERL